ncbi:MAG: hypothetical protein U0350_22065 [Caldilineaceae bacterium]
MLSVPALYENGKIILLEAIPHLQRARLIVTVLEELPEASPIEQPKQVSPDSWLGSMSHTIVGEIGDLVSPLEDTWADWEVLRE